MSDVPPPRRRGRLTAAARRIAAAAETAQMDEADLVGVGVRAVAKEIVGEIEPGALYWRAPFQYVVEQAAPRIAKQFGVPEALMDELRAYLLAGLNEYLIALVGDLDVEHFENWRLAALAAEHDR